MFKPLELVTPDDAIDYAEVLPLYASLGHAVGRWGLLEFSLVSWLSDLSGMSYHMAKDIFLSAQSFRGRIDIMNAALENCGASDGDKEFMSAVLGKVDLYSQFRNSIVHGCPMGVYRPDGLQTGMAVFDMYGPLDAETIAQGITIEQLDQAARNFNALYELIEEARFARRGGSKAPSFFGPPQPLAILQQRVELLPNVAGSSELSKHQRGRLRQLQAAAQTPRPKRSNGKGA